MDEPTWGEAIVKYKDLQFELNELKQILKALNLVGNGFVKEVECPSCQNRFRYYFSIPNESKFIQTIVGVTMPDIAMCVRIDCDKKMECYRYRAVPQKYQTIFEPSKIGNDCEYFWKIDSNYKLAEIPMAERWANG